MFIILTIYLQVIIAVSSLSDCVPELQEYKVLNDGNRIPALGLGTYANASQLKLVNPSVTYAIEVGYRLFDTAHLYENEQYIGQALTQVFRLGIVQREDIFVLTKLDTAVPCRAKVVPALRKSLKKLNLAYVDLFLIHTPLNVYDYPNYDINNIWRGMEDAKKLGLAKSIGISNFNSSQVNRLLRYAKIRPAVNEIEVNPTYTNLDLVAYCQSQGIVVIAASPFGYLPSRAEYPFAAAGPIPPTPEDPTLVKIAEKYGKQTYQVVIRYLIDRDVIPIPRSHNRTHILSNFDVFDFSLTKKEIYTINEFNRNIQVYPTDEESKALFRD